MVHFMTQRRTARRSRFLTTEGQQLDTLLNGASLGMAS